MAEYAGILFLSLSAFAIGAGILVAVILTHKS